LSIDAKVVEQALNSYLNDFGDTIQYFKAVNYEILLLLTGIKKGFQEK